MSWLDRFRGRGAEPEREQRNYTSALVAAAVSAASGKTAQTDAVAATEISAGWWSRALAGAEDGGVLGPDVLLHIGRELALSGDVLLEIRTDRGRLELLPAISWTVRGSASPSTWSYEVTCTGPDGAFMRRLVADRVVHVAINRPPETPWEGRSPVQAARDSGQLAAAIELRLRQEAAGPGAQLLPVPDADLSAIKAELAAAAGGVVMVPTTAGGFGAGAAEAPKRDWQTTRLGLSPPPEVVSLRSAVEASVLGLYGLPPLMMVTAGGVREGRLRFLRSTAVPLARVIEAEVALKLDRPGFRLRWPELELAEAGQRASAAATWAGTELLDDERILDLVGVRRG